MSQTNPDINWDTPGAEALPRLDDVLAAMQSTWSGPLPPPTSLEGHLWVDNSSTSQITLKIYYAARWLSVLTILSSGEVMLMSNVAGGASNIANIGQARAGTNNTRTMTPLRVADYVSARIATDAQARAGADLTKLMTPALVKAAIDSLGSSGGGGSPGGGSPASSRGLIKAPTVANTSGTFFKDTSARIIIITAIGAGGGGGGGLNHPHAYNPASYGSGGGGGGFARKTFAASAISARQRYSIGRGGRNGSLGRGLIAGTAGISGSATSISGIPSIIAYGGRAGLGGGGGDAPVLGGLGGGGIGKIGTNGGDGYGIMGGSSFYAGAERGAGSDGSGGGGGIGGSRATAGYPGGNGVIIFEEYA